MSDQHREHLRAISDALDNGEAYLFIGAGLSMNAVKRSSATKEAFKTWTDFMLQLAYKLWPHLTEENLQKKIAGEQLLIAQLFEEEFGFEAFYKELLKAVPYQHYSPSPIHKELLGLSGEKQWKGFITTNQDRLVEQTLTDLHIYHDIVMNDLDVSTKSAAVKLYKIHGSMERPESIIFTEEQYRTYEQQHPLLHVKIKSIFAENTIVFVGFSLTDPNFKTIYGWVKDMLQSNYQKKAYAFVFEQDIDDYTRRYWEKRNIILLPIQGKQYRDSGRAFVEGMREYMKVLKEGKSVGDQRSGYIIEDGRLRELFQLKGWSKENTQELISLFEKRSTDSSHLPWEAGSFFKNIFPQLDDRARKRIVESLYSFSHPFYQINGKAIIDVHIDYLKQDEVTDKEALYEVLTEKAIYLFKDGRYDDVVEHVTGVLEECHEMPSAYRNELLYWSIVVEKYRLNFQQVRQLTKQITVEWNDPLSVNRIAAIHLFLGDYSLALNFYNSAIQAAEQSKDEWSLYVASMAKRYLLGELGRENGFLKQEQEKTQQTISNLYKTLNEQKNDAFVRWQKVDELKNNWWTKYKNWKEQQDPNASGYNSMKSSIVYDVYETFWFYEAYGFPHAVYMDKKLDVIPDIFVENQLLYKAVQFSIFLGLEKQIRSFLRFENIASIPEEELSRIYGHSIDIAESLISYLQVVDEQTNIHLFGIWSEVVWKIWGKIVPVLYDEQIEKITSSVWKIQSLLAHVKRPVFSIEVSLIEVLDICIYFRDNLEDKKKLLQWLEGNIQKLAYNRPFKNMDWDAFRGLQMFSDETVKWLVFNDDSYYTNLVYHFLKEEMVTTEQKNLIFQAVYEQEKEDIDCQLLLFPYYSELDKEKIHLIISTGIEKFRVHNSSSDVAMLHRLAYTAEFMSEEQKKLLIEIVEEKIRFAKEKNWGGFPKPFTEEGITTAYFSFLNHLIIAQKIDSTLLFKKIEEYANWGRHMAKTLTQLSSIGEEANLMISSTLLKGLKTNVSKKRINYCFLAGYWLKQKTKLNAIDHDLIFHLIVSLYDTNIKVSSEAVRGIAWLVQNDVNHLTEEQMENILGAININQSHIGYLTNVAFLFNELNKKEGLPQDIKKDIDKILETLSGLRYANVRREID